MRERSTGLRRSVCALLAGAMLLAQAPMTSAGEESPSQLAERLRKLEETNQNLLRQFERWVMLQIIDTQWKDHLLSMDHLKEGIGLRGYGQRDPLTEYKREAFDLFQDMVDRVKATVVELLLKMQVTREAAERPAPGPKPAEDSVPAPPRTAHGRG